MKINYECIDDKFKKTIKSIEDKPHVLYIRYLLSKRYSPIVIRKELQKLGLSAPHEPNLVAYYMIVLDPVIKALGVGKLYADYKNKLLRKNKRGDFAKNILNYRIDLGQDLDMQVNFNKFVKEIDISELWLNEIYKFHGRATNMPVDENGKRILQTTSALKTADKILLSPKRYIIDKLILENVPDARIAAYCKENIKLQINDYDVICYKKVFFNVRTNSVEDRIHALECEKNSLETLLSDIDESSEYADIAMGEKVSLKRQTQQRLDELNDNIKTLNMMYSEFAFKSATQDQCDFETMFTDIVCRAYNRFTQLDNYKDRDIIDPLFKTAKIMSFAHDKVESIKLSNTSNTINGDRHSNAVIMELYGQRVDEIAKEQLELSQKALNDPNLTSNIKPDEIDGLEELSSLFSDDEE